MFVLEIIPLSSTAPAEPLSYRSSQNVPAGTIVAIPLRRKTIPGLVVGSIPVREAKAELKNASFGLLKSGSEKIGTLPTSLLKAASVTATYHATTLGAVLSALLVPALSEDMIPTLARGNGFRIERIEATSLERKTNYEATVRKNKKGVTLLLVPTQVEIDQYAEIFKAVKPVVISGKLPAKKREAAIRRASFAGATPDLPVSLVITTPSFSWIPIPHLGHIIIERVSAGGYVLPKRPYLDVRYALTELARARNIPLTYGDYPLPLEYRSIPGKPLAKAPSSMITIVDARTDKENPSQKEKQAAEGPWKAISNELQQVIQKVLDSDGRVALLAVRKGYAPVVVCRDCGTTVTDEFGRTLTFTTTGGKRSFRSVDGKTAEAAHTKCKVCGSWNLLPLGIGIERVEEELRKAFPTTSILRIEPETSSAASLARTKAAIREPRTISIGTEGMLPWLSPETPVDLGVIVSADSLLALPFWRSRERFVRIGLLFAERSKRVLISTRHPEDAALSALVSPTRSDFWKEELGLRKILQYPPFGTLIIFQVEATAARLAQARAAITAACAPFMPIELAPRAISATLQRGVSVLHLPPDVWPDKDLSERIARLSPAITVHIDSESLW